MNSPYPSLLARAQWILLAAGLVLGTTPSCLLRAADPVFSGPQAGEKITGFKVLDLAGAGAGKERDPVAENSAAPTVYVFVHTVERSLVPLLRVIDEYGALRKERIRSEVVFLFADRVAGEQRVKAVTGSLKLKSRVGLSLDGAEGPGNWGLNKECMMTIVAARDSKAVANFALVQPGIADAPKVLAALAAACGDPTPPGVEELAPKPAARNEMAARGNEPKKEFPGAPPEDPKLMGLLRQFIKPTNDTATVDRVLKDVESHIRGNPELTLQASNGWTRVLHFGDRYGTAYAREKGQALLGRIKAGAYQNK